jgi:TM2 domain-containing membrane protein YozV
MNCYLHPDVAATAFCRSCGRPLCSYCQRPAEGTVFCQDHVPAPYAEQPGSYSAPPEAGPYAPPPPNPGPYAAPNPYYAPPPTGVRTSPLAAFWLGLIPGVGAIYNGQYLKGLVHAIITGLLISLTNAADGTAGEPLLGMLTFAFWCYMPFEAYHTAKKRLMGVPVDEWSSLMAPQSRAGRIPIGPIILIGIGVIFLLDTLHLVDFREFGRFWPVLLILVGAYMLYARVSSPRAPASRDASVPPQSAPSAADNVMGTRHEQ